MSYPDFFKRMKNNIHRRKSSFYFALFCSFFSLPAFAQIEVFVTENDRGYEVEVNFHTPLRYQSHSPRGSANKLDVLMKQEGAIDPEQLEELNRYSNLSWDTSSGIPLRDIIFDAGLITNPRLTMQFTRNVNFNVRNSSDLRSIIITIETIKTSDETLMGTAPALSSEKLIQTLEDTDPKMAALLERPNQAMLDKNYSHAVQLFMKMRDTGNSEVSQYAQELIGVAREYNNQLAHARAEYRKYLEDYPESDGAKRVSQRLSALITAAARPKQKLTQGRRQQASDGLWDTRVFGSVSQTYYRDEVIPEDGDELVTRSNLTNDLNFTTRSRKGQYEFKTQFDGSFEEDFRSDGDGGEFLPDVMSVEARDSGRGLYARLGRQPGTTGGVLGRFDGMHAAYEVNPALTINTVYGYPVDTTEKTEINTDREFYGISADIATLWDGWDFNTFYITQDNGGIKDREAVGGEARYFDTRKTFFTLIDYDIFYNDLNIFMLLATLKVRPSTTLNLVVNYRNSPLLATTNAIQGQGVEELEDLSDRFSEDELNQLAEKRTADNDTITAGITQQLNEIWQVIGEITVTEFGDIKASEGIEAIPGTGKEYYYSAQFVGSKIFYENDTMILSTRYADTYGADTYTIDANWRVNWSRELRLNPRLRFDYREDKKDDDTRWLVRPFVRVEYRLKKWMKFRFEFGYEWRDETFTSDSQTTNSYFANIGYRAQF